MIVAEDILTEIFSQLPKAKDINNIEFPIRFSHGDYEDLNPYLKSLSGAKYPIIWMSTVEWDEDAINHVTTGKVVFWIAKQSSDRNALNPTVWASEFKNILNPILKNVKTALMKSGVTRMLSEKTKVSRHANFTQVSRSVNGDVSQSPAIDCWNVIEFKCNLEFQEKADGTPLCINQIRF